VSLSTIDKSVLVLVLILGSTGIFFLTPSIHGNDGVLNFVYLRSLVEDGDLDFANDYAVFDRVKKYPYKFTDLPVHSETQKYMNRYGIGSSILWAPFYLLCRLYYALFQPGTAFDSYGYPAALAVSTGSFFYSSMGLLLLLLFFRKFFRPIVSLAAVLFILFATPLAFYTYLHPSMSHANAFFLASATLVSYLMLPRNPTRRFSFFRWLAPGFFAGLLAITRFQDAIIVVAFIIGEIHYLSSVKKVDVKVKLKTITTCYVAFFVAFFIAALPQLIAWKYLYGSFFSGPVPYLEYEGFNLLFPRNIFKVLFSPWHGLFYWHPFLLLGVIGLAVGFFFPSRYIKRDATLFRALLIFSLFFWFEVYVTGCWEVWHGGASFGQRLLISAFPSLTFGIALLLSRAARKTGVIIFGIIFALALLWNINLAIKYGRETIPRQEPVAWHTMLGW